MRQATESSGESFLPIFLFVTSKGIFLYLKSVFVLVRGGCTAGDYVPVYGKVSPVLVPEYESWSVPGVGGAGGAVARDRHPLPYHAHHLVLHHWTEHDQQPSIEGHVTFLDELVIVHVRVIGEAFGLGQLVCLVENRGQERQKKQHLLHWKFLLETSNLKSGLNQPLKSSTCWIRPKRGIFLFFLAIRVLTDPIS